MQEAGSRKQDNGQAGRRSVISGQWSTISSRSSSAVCRRLSVVGHSSAVLLLFLLLLAVPRNAFAQEGGTNRAGLIVVHGDGRVLTRCVTFAEESISGVALLQRSGLSVLANSGPMGSAVCTVNGEGCPANDCFCQCKSSPCAYWNYFHRNADGSWAYSGMGAVVWTLRNGDVDGWVWGDGSAPPPAIAFETICAAETAAQPTSAVPIATPIPPETPIPTPTALPDATSTAQPSATPTATAISATTVAPTITIASAATVVPTVTAVPTAATFATPSATPTSPPIATPFTPSSHTPTPPHTPTPTPPNAPTQPPVRQYAPFFLLLGVIGGVVLIQAKRR